MCTHTVPQNAFIVLILARITNDMYFVVALFGINLLKLASFELSISRQMAQECHSYAINSDDLCVCGTNGDGLGRAVDNSA